MSQSVPPEAPSSGEPGFVTAGDFGTVIPASTGATTITFLGTNFPGVSSGSSNPYTWFQVNAPDGTKVYIPAWK